MEQNPETREMRMRPPPTNRLRILDEEEQTSVFGRPRFTPAERIEYFSLSASEKVVLEEFHSLKSKLCFLLQLGYFKARHLFFTFCLAEVEMDAIYLRDHYFPEFHLTDLELAKGTRLKQQRLIRELCQYHRCGAPERRQLETKAQQAARRCGQTGFSFA